MNRPATTMCSAFVPRKHSSDLAMNSNEEEFKAELKNQSARHQNTRQK